MTDVHRRFLQLLMTHGVLEECDVKRLQKHCYKVHDCEYPALPPGCSAAVRSGASDAGLMPRTQSTDASDLGIQVCHCLTPAHLAYLQLLIFFKK